MASELLMGVSRDENECARLRSRRMAETDRLSNLATAEERGRRIGREEGFAEGITRGIEQGIEKGIEQGIARERKRRDIEIAADRKKRDKEKALKLLSLGHSISVIKVATDLTEAEIKEIIEQQQQ